MFKIGDFSKLCRVTVKTLRYYDGLDPGQSIPDSSRKSIKRPHLFLNEGFYSIPLVLLVSALIG
jgi:hypothetical protein